MEGGIACSVARRKRLELGYETWIAFCLVLQWWMPDMHLSQPRMPRVNSNDESVQVHCLKQMDSSLRDADCGGGWAQVEMGVHGNSVLSAQFGCEPKTALKNKGYL